jgi:hypothetical protein
MNLVADNIAQIDASDVVWLVARLVAWRVRLHIKCDINLRDI